MNKKNLIIVMLIGLIAGALAGGAVAFLLEDGDNGDNGTIATTATGTDGGTSTGEVACTMEAKLCPDGSYVGRVPPDCEFAPCPELPPVAQSENIRVYAPEQGASVSSPATISGEARVFEGTVNYRILDDNGTVIGEGFTTAAATDVGLFGPYSVDAVYSQPQTPIGRIEVFNYSARDGSVENLVTVRVMFTPGG